MMSVFDDWARFNSAILEAQDLIYRLKSLGRVELYMENISPVIMELKFLYVYVGYTNLWREDASSSPTAAANELKTYLQQDFIHCFTFTHEPHHQNQEITTFLNLKIAHDLKPKIRAAYQSWSFSSTRASQYPASTEGNQHWNFFCLSMESILHYFSEEGSSLLGDPLRREMRALKSCLTSLYWPFLVSGGGDSDDWSPWKDNMRIYIGGLVVQLAHLCCFCWYNQPILHKSILHDMAVGLSDLHRKMDPATPDFLKIALGCLKHHDDGKHLERSMSSFLDCISFQGAEPGVLKELQSLLTCLMKIREDQHHMEEPRRILLAGIQQVVLEARYLEGKCKREHKIRFLILFAMIWSLKAEILIKSSGTLLIHFKDNLVEAVREGHMRLHHICSPTDELSSEYQILKLIEEVHKHLQWRCQSCSSPVDSSLHINVSSLLLKPLAPIKVLEAKPHLAQLLEMDVPIIPLSLMHKIRSLHEGLSFLIRSDIYRSTENTEDEKLILVEIDKLATKVVSLRKIFPDQNVTNTVVENMHIGLDDLVDKLRCLNVELRRLYIQVEVDNPKIPGLCFMEGLLETLNSLISCKHRSFQESIDHIESICIDFRFIISRFHASLEHCIEKQELKDLYTRLVEMAYLVEHVIDLMLDEEKVARQRHSVWLYYISEEIRHIKMQVIDFDGNNGGDDYGIHKVPNRLMMSVVSQVTTTTTIQFGVKDQEEAIIDRLIRGTLQRDVISISGMPGIGKTTLANRLIRNPKVMFYFHIRAWCCVSQTYKKRDLLLDILSNIFPITDNIHALSAGDLELLLYQKLKGRRYLIVMDDLWSTSAWYDLQLSFPDDSKGSRILLTTRLQDMVSKISTDTYPLCPLSESDSWELLKLKIFGKQECPKELAEVGQQIAKNCQGLPLAISAIAGLLRKGNKRLCSWQQISKKVSSHVVNDPNMQCKQILELSYNHLPDHLKACFLYFGTFPEDRDISVQRLQWLWISEGFVHKPESNKTLEDIAEDYLLDLVGRSLVMVAKTGSNGKVKACRVHDVVRDLCLLKAGEDRFLQLISADDQPYSCFDALDYGLLYELFSSSNSITYKRYRLYFHVDREQFVVSRPSGPFVRSLVFSATTDMCPRCSYDVSFISENFKRLRLLDLESINMGSSLTNGIESLVNLRYLAISGDMESIPDSLSKLQNLETLFVRSLKRKVVLPKTIWRMKKLRHIYVSNHAIFTLPDAADNWRFVQLDSLVTLSFPYFRLGKETNELIMIFPNLRKLKCVVSEFMNSSKEFALETLRQLESLKISYYGKALKCGELKLPTGLKKLTLSNFYLSRHQISEIGRLHSLEVLKLLSCDFEGSWNCISDIAGRLQNLEVLKLVCCSASEALSWGMTEGEFPKLKYLELDNLSIVQWDACCEHLPQLQQLVLRNCTQLKEFPLDFASIPTLEKIEVQLCGSSVNESVREIEEKEVEGLKIVINNSLSS